MSYQFPEHLFFDKKHHVWCLPESDLLIRIGIDPLGLASLGDLAYLSLNPNGSEVIQGQPMGMLEAAKMTGELIAPVGGKITERNQVVLQDPNQVNREPDGAGWLAVLESESWNEDSKKLVSGQDVGAWSQEELKRYREQGGID